MSKLEQATIEMAEAVKPHRWRLFEIHQTSDARDWARAGNFAIQIAPSGTEGWLLVKDKEDLLSGAGSVGASPQPVKHPVDSHGCARLSRYNLEAALALAEADLDRTDLAMPPQWAAFPWNQRPEAVAWATSNFALLTQEDPQRRWLLGPWSLMRRSPRSLSRRRAKQDDLVGWLALEKEELWREAYDLCSRAPSKITRSISPQTRLGIVGLSNAGFMDPIALWDKLCLKIAGVIDQLQPGSVHLGCAPWTDSAALWVLRQEGWVRSVHLCLPAPWDIARGRFSVADPQAYIDKVREQPTFRGGEQAEAFARRIFISRDRGTKHNLRMDEFEAATQFPTRDVVAEIIGRVVDGANPPCSYSEHSRTRGLYEDIGAISTHLIIACPRKESVGKFEKYAEQMCTGQKIYLPMMATSKLHGMVPP